MKIFALITLTEKALHVLQGDLMRVRISHHKQILGFSVQTRDANHRLFPTRGKYHHGKLIKTPATGRLGEEERTS
jgi:hypothetical protein